uniref:Dienelactone hydrolase domain-containing protein n=1 Tax=Panagrolaimus sp. ES5 TaxID=591445 RepID=A0AC34GNN5_9BILA
MEIKEGRHEYKDSNGTVLEGLLIYPASADKTGEKFPVVLVHHAFAGITEHEEEKTRELAQLGYVAFAADLSRYNCGIAAAVSFHGSLDPLPPLENLPKEETEPIKSSIMICHGDADTHIPVEKAVAIMEELRNRQTDFQFISYANAKHAFTEIKWDKCDIPGIGYDEKACRRSWNQTLYHLDEILREKK